VAGGLYSTEHQVGGCIRVAALDSVVPGLVRGCCWGQVGGYDDVLLQALMRGQVVEKMKRQVACVTFCVMCALMLWFRSYKQSYGLGWQGGMWLVNNCASGGLLYQSSCIGLGGAWAREGASR
jgi:hypothetical protein